MPSAGEVRYGNSTYAAYSSHDLSESQNRVQSTKMKSSSFHLPLSLSPRDVSQKYDRLKSERIDWICVCAPLHHTIKAPSVGKCQNIDVMSLPLCICHYRF